MTPSIESLLQEYLEAVNIVVLALCQEMGISDLRDVRVNRSGNTTLFGGGTYTFHGIGCVLEATDLEIDWDFTEEGKVDAFDPWKVFDFLEHRYPSRSKWESWSAFQKDIEALEESHKIRSTGRGNLMALVVS